MTHSIPTTSVTRPITMSAYNEASIKEYLDMAISTVIMANDVDHADKYPLMVMTVKADGRLVAGSEDPDPKFFAIAIRDDFTDDQKLGAIRGKMDGVDDRNAQVKFNHGKLLRLLESCRYSK